MGNRSRIRPGSAPRAPSNGERLQIFIVVEKRFQFGLVSLENLHWIYFKVRAESLWAEVVEGVFECYDQSTKQNILYLNAPVG